MNAFTPKKKMLPELNPQLERVPDWGLSPKIPQSGYDDTQHMHIGRGRRIGRARFYG